MPSLNFQAQFVPGILAFLDKKYAKKTGIRPKTTTIRARRKHPIKKGDTLHLFRALRTVQVQRLGVAYCRKLEEITISQTSREDIQIRIDGFLLSLEQAQTLSQEDGFSCLGDMVRWFSLTHGLPFKGDRIHFTTTYDRKYFVNRSVKKRGYALKLETTEKTILITSEQYESARSDRYVRELSTKHNYGVQIVNPLLEMVEKKVKQSN